MFPSHLAEIVLIPTESLFALAIVIVVSLLICAGLGALVIVLGKAGSQLSKLLFKNSNKLTFRIFGAEVRLQSAGLVFIFLAIVMVLTLMYVILRITPGHP